MIFFASRSENPTQDFKEMKERILRQSEGRKVNFEYATEEELLDQISASHAIYIHGGSTNKLLKVLRSYPDLGPLVAGKTVAGSSAGAYALSKFGTSHSEDAVREGLGLLPVRVVCHYESPTLPPAPGAVAIIKKMDTDMELVLLRDFEWKVFSTV